MSRIRSSALCAVTMLSVCLSCGEAPTSVSASTSTARDTRPPRPSDHEGLPPGLDPETARALTQLGYGDWSVDGVDARQIPAGVVRQVPWALSEGTHLLTVASACEAQLITSAGHVLHRWELPADFRDTNGLVFPAAREGAIFALYNDEKLEKRDWRGDLVWSVEAPGHHDVWEASDGSLAMLVEQVRELDVDGEPLYLMDNGVARIGADGELRDVVWFGQLFTDRIEARKLKRLREHLSKTGPPEEQDSESILDRFHTNALIVLEHDVPGFGRRGQVLLSIRNLSLLAVVDLDAGSIVWEWGPDELDNQHHPSLLPDDRLLVFDNGRRREWSRVLELDPVSREILWEQREIEDQPFFSHVRGSVERMPNGNSMVVVSNSGRVVEVMPGGEVVWEFLHPGVDEGTGARRVIYRMPWRGVGWPEAVD